uniref:Uncharacterized protein n=1 Tax=Siphoviridae sp. ctBLh2 TaxID=2827803 RepID=A0A8S5S376_9CAUD|nr:MAG TPA: hypothetical protein [Siphoviridae sp. ctBLh2]
MYSSFPGAVLVFGEPFGEPVSGNLPSVPRVRAPGRIRCRPTDGSVTAF